MKIDSAAFFEALAAEMNSHPERFTVLGEADMTAVVTMERTDADAFRVELTFEALECTGVREVERGALAHNRRLSNGVRNDIGSYLLLG